MAKSPAVVDPVLEEQRQDIIESAEVAAAQISAQPSIASDTLVTRDQVENEVKALAPYIPIGSLVGANDPRDVITTIVSVANQLRDIVEKKKLYVMLKTKQGEKQHIRFEGWQALGGMLGVTLKEEYCQFRYESEDGPQGKFIALNGWEAGVVVIRNRDGMVIGRGTAYCGRDESNWRSRDMFAVRSMAITRAGAKALKNCFGWIISIAGYEVTPAEEMLFLNDVDVVEGDVKDVSQDPPFDPPYQQVAVPAPAPNAPKITDVLANYGATYKLDRSEVMDIMKGIGFPKPAIEKADLYKFAIDLVHQRGEQGITDFPSVEDVEVAFEEYQTARVNGQTE